jgi:hypothetical protein
VLSKIWSDSRSTRRFEGVWYEDRHYWYRPLNTVMEYEMGTAYGMHRGQERCIQSFGGEA